MTRAGEAPRDRAAATYSRGRCDTIAPRRRRATSGMPAVPMATVTETTLGPSRVTRPMATMSPGMASMASIARMRTVSTHPPRPPARAPTTTPRATPSATEANPMRREYRAP